MGNDTTRHALEERVVVFTPEEHGTAVRLEAARLETECLEAECQEVARLEQERRDADARALIVANEIAIASHCGCPYASGGHPQCEVPSTYRPRPRNPPLQQMAGNIPQHPQHYALADHVLSNDDHSSDISLKRMDCTVLSWLYGAITTELLEVVLNRDDDAPTAHIIWLGLEKQFIGNKETHALLLDAEFRTFVQGSLSVANYCCHLKTMADRLTDLSKLVWDRILVLNIVCGLIERFTYMGALIQR